jgi:hypothetical protein
VPSADSDILTNTGPRADVVILTALAVEQAAVVQALGNCSMRQWRGWPLGVGDVGQRVLVFPISGMGTAGATQAAQRVIDIWNPARIMLAGICGGCLAPPVTPASARPSPRPSGRARARQGEPGGTDRRYEVHRPDEPGTVPVGRERHDWVHTIATPWPRPVRACAPIRSCKWGRW